MINQRFRYECNVKKLEEGRDLIDKTNSIFNSITIYNKRIYIDKVSQLLNEMIDERADFISHKSDEVIENFKKHFSLEDVSFQELFEKVPGLNEIIKVQVELNHECEKMLDELILLLNRLILINK